MTSAGLPARKPPVFTASSMRGSFAAGARFGSRMISIGLVGQRARQVLHSACAPGGLPMLLAGSLYAHFGGVAFLAMAAIGGSALFWERAGRA